MTDAATPNDHARRVFVFGAGFTRAFYPNAPLLVDYYGGAELVEQFANLPFARHLLQTEIALNRDGNLDIERLLTRLYGAMPYDPGMGNSEELALLRRALMQKFLSRLEPERSKEVNPQMAALAKHCVDNEITCVTFNYDDFFDRALWAAYHADGFWDPDSGYGFFCAPAAHVLGDPRFYMGSAKMRLFKLHGSVNWRIRLGSPKPYSVDSVFHLQDWYPPYVTSMAAIDRLEGHLEPEPFVIPPVLAKPDLVSEPVLRLVWTLAYQALAEADEVTFVGYSLPVTDVASSFLFGETLGGHEPSSLRIIDSATKVSKQREIKVSYRKVLPQVDDDSFRFGGARRWAASLIHTAKGDSSSS